MAVQWSLPILIAAMRLLAKVLMLLRTRARRRSARSGYGPEVLFSGWVQLPPAFTEFGQGARSGARRTPQAG